MDDAININKIKDALLGLENKQEIHVQSVRGKEEFIEVRARRSDDVYTLLLKSPERLLHKEFAFEDIDLINPLTILAMYRVTKPVNEGK